ncbi:hypothetical protein G9A89_017717 [Geosiphon pyriformis]|nr:hypothetical protein G9A89_017717 [Geosiphon pyriformis]
MKKAKELAICEKIIVNNDPKEGKQPFKSEGNCQGDSIILIRMQLIGLWQKALVKFKSSDSVLMSKNSVCVVLAVNDKKLWVKRDCYQTILYTLPVGTTAHNLSNLLESYGGKICFISHYSSSYVYDRCAIVCFVNEASKLAAIGSILVFKSVNLCWAGLFLAYCAHCKQFGHISTRCSLSENFGACVHLANIYIKKEAPIVCSVSFGEKTWAQVASSSFFCMVSSNYSSVSLSSGVKPVPLVFNSLGDSCLLLANQVSGILKKLSFVKLVPLASSFHVSFLVVITSVIANIDLDIVLDNMMVLLSPLFSVVAGSVVDLSSSSSKVLIIKVGGLEFKIVALEMSVESVLEKLDCLCSRLENIIHWHRNSGNMVSIITETKLRFSNRLWIRDKFNNIRVFSFGLDKSFFGVRIVIIMNTSLACHVNKVSEMSGWLLSVKLLFKNKLSVSILGLYAGAFLAVCFSQSNDINFMIAKMVNKSSFVVLGGDFNENDFQRSTSFKKCLDLGLVNSLGGSSYVKKSTWANSWGMAKTIDFLFIFLNLVNAVVDCEVSDVGEFFDTDHQAVFMSVSLGGFLDEQLNSLEKQASVIQDIVNSGTGFDHVRSALFGARKFYHAAKLAESLRAKKANIRSAIDRRMKSFEINKSHTIRSVLECSFHKVALNHLVVNNNLILEPDLVKAKMNVIMESWTRKCEVTFSEVLIEFDELANVVSDLPNGKAIGLLVLDMLLVFLNSCLSNESVFSSWKEAWVLIIPKPYEWEGVLTNIHSIALIKTACKILSKILSNRISLAYSTFDVFYGDNFSVLKGMLTQSPIFAIGLTYNSVDWKHLEKSLVRIKMCSKFIRFFGGIHRDCTNRIMTDFGLTGGYHESIYGYKLNSHFISKSGYAKSQAGLSSFFAADVFIDDTIWVGSSQKATQHILNVAGEFFQINNISINNDKTVAIPINSRTNDPSLFISGLLISIAKKGDSHWYLGIFLSIESLSKPSMAKTNSDVCFFTNLVLKKAILDKQLLYLVLAVLHLIVSYKTQFSFVSVGVYNKWDAMSEDKVASLISFANSDDILGYLFSYRFHNLQVLCWHPVYPLSSSIHIHVSASNNFLAGMIHILLDCNLFLDGSLANFFRFRGRVLMLNVLGKFQFLQFSPSLQQYGIVFVDQLCDCYGSVFDWHTFKHWKRLDLFLISVGSLNILESCDFASICDCLSQVHIDSLLVYTDRSLSNLDTVECKASTATFFKDIDVSLGIGVSGLMLSTLVELQAIALVLECVLSLSFVKLFSDSQSALDACSVRLNIVILSMLFTPVMLFSLINIFLLTWMNTLCWLMVVLFLAIPDILFMIFIAQFVVCAERLALIPSFWQAVCFLRLIGSVCLCRPSTNTHTYFMKALHHQLPVAVQKHLYNRLYPSVLCLYCGNVEASDHVFSCRIDDFVRHQLLESHVDSWKAVSGLTHSSLDILQFLSSCTSDLSLSMALYKDFVFNGWFYKVVAVFHDPKVAGLEIVKFEHSLSLAFRNDIWSVHAKHCAYMEKYELISLDSSVLISVSGLALGLLAWVVKLLGITDAFSFCLFFSGVSDSVSVHIAA